MITYVVNQIPYFSSFGNFSPGFLLRDLQPEVFVGHFQDGKLDHWEEKSAKVSGKTGRHDKFEDRDHSFLGGGNSNMLFIFTPNLGEMVQFDSYFQMGWNRQLASFFALQSLSLVNVCNGLRYVDHYFGCCACARCFCMLFLWKGLVSDTCFFFTHIREDSHFDWCIFQMGGSITN